MELTQSYLKTILHYDPDTGNLSWLPRDLSLFKTFRDCAAWNARCSGTVAGRVDRDGYLQVSISAKKHMAHRLIFLYATGELPPLETDHINGNRSDNRWDNLRCVTRWENAKNQKLPSNNKSGVIGVSWAPRHNKWIARIGADGKTKHIGLFDTIEEAAAARASASRKYGYHQNHGMNRG